MPLDSPPLLTLVRATWRLLVRAGDALAFCWDCTPLLALLTHEDADVRWSTAQIAGALFKMSDAQRATALAQVYSICACNYQPDSVDKHRLLSLNDRNTIDLHPHVTKYRSFHTLRVTTEIRFSIQPHGYIHRHLTIPI
jgi:hypothetical protein